MNANLDMTLRDWFAGQIMATLVARPSIIGAQRLAMEAYNYADALIAVREQQQ